MEIIDLTNETSSEDEVDITSSTDDEQEVVDHQPSSSHVPSTSRSKTPAPIEEMIDLPLHCHQVEAVPCQESPDVEDKKRDLKTDTEDMTPVVQDINLDAVPNNIHNVLIQDAESLIGGARDVIATDGVDEEGLGSDDSDILNGVVEDINGNIPGPSTLNEDERDLDRVSCDVVTESVFIPESDNQAVEDADQGQLQPDQQQCDVEPHVDSPITEGTPTIENVSLDATTPTFDGPIEDIAHPANVEHVIPEAPCQDHEPAEDEHQVSDTESEINEVSDLPEGSIECIPPPCNEQITSDVIPSSLDNGKDLHPLCCTVVFTCSVPSCDTFSFVCCPTWFICKHLYYMGNLAVKHSTSKVHIPKSMPFSILTST